MEFTGSSDIPAEGGGDDRPKIMRQGYPVPADLIGFIIGKGGANIDQIQRASSAKLSTKDDNGPHSFQREWVYIQIEGTGREVSVCCEKSVAPRSIVDVEKLGGETVCSDPIVKA